MKLVDLVRRALCQPGTTEDGRSAPLVLDPPASESDVRQLEAGLPCPLPADIRELLAFCSGFSGGSAGVVQFVDFTGRQCSFEYEDAFPHGLPIAGDGCGNFWVVDLLPASTMWGPIYYASHDAPVILFQSPSLEEFLAELFRLSLPPWKSLVGDVHGDRLFDVWRTNPDVRDHDTCAAGADPELRAFAERLGPAFQFIDMRHAPVGLGFSWGRYGARTVVKRHGTLPIFAYQQRKGLMSRLFGDPPHEEFLTTHLNRFYDELADWWPLFSPLEDYVAEAEDLLPRLGPRSSSAPPTLLELGAGGGSLAFYLRRHYTVTLTDLAPAMLEVSKVINPDCEHIAGDMRSLRLDRLFDVVLVHDAIMYATSPAEVLATLRTAACHCRPGGTVVVIPDCVRETFEAGTDEGGGDGPDGRGLRYLEWRSDPDPSDDTYVVDYAFLLRDTDGGVTAVHDRHIEGVFARPRWLQWFADAGLSVRRDIDPWGRDIFVATPMAQ